MLEITNINFKLKTVDNLKCSGNVKDIQMSMIKNTFCVNVIYNEGETITTEYTKPKEQDTIEEVNMNLFDKETETTQQEQMNILCKVEEQQEEVKELEPEPEPGEIKEPEPEPEPEEVKEEEKEVKEEEPEQQEQPKDKSLSIEEIKELLNKCVIILKYMKFMDYYNITNKKLFIL